MQEREGARIFDHVGQLPLDYSTWTESVRGGDTFVTNGPLLGWDVEESLVVWAGSHGPLERIQLLKDGNVIFENSESLQIATDAEGWFVVRCEGRNGEFAISSPIKYERPTE